MAGEYLDEIVISSTTFSLHDTENREVTSGISSGFGNRIATLEQAYEGLSSTYAPLSHTHVGSQVTVTMGGTETLLSTAVETQWSGLTTVTTGHSALVTSVEAVSATVRAMGLTIAGLSNTYAPYSHTHDASTLTYTSGGIEESLYDAVTGKADYLHTHDIAQVSNYNNNNTPLSMYLPPSPIDSTQPMYSSQYFNRNGSWSTVAAPTKPVIDGIIGATVAANVNKVYAVTSSVVSGYVGDWMTIPSATVTSSAVFEAIGATASTATAYLNNAGGWTSGGDIVTSEAVTAALGASSSLSESLYLNQRGGWSAPYMDKDEIDGKLTSLDSSVISQGYVYAYGTNTSGGVVYNTGRWKDPKALIGAGQGGSVSLFLNQAGSWAVPTGVTATKAEIDAAMLAKASTNSGKIYTAHATSGGVWTATTAVVTKAVTDRSIGAYGATAGYLYAATGGTETAAEWKSPFAAIGAGAAGAATLYLNQQGTWAVPAGASSMAASSVLYSNVIEGVSVANVYAALNRIVVLIGTATALTQAIIDGTSASNS